MNELVFLKNNQALTTSLKVVEVFEKCHDTVLRAIENAKSNFRKNNYDNLRRRKRRIASNNRDNLALWLAKGENYHLPYRDCKSAFETYARLSYINQRLLPN